jgi:hypothetical protein
MKRRIERDRSKERDRRVSMLCARERDQTGSFGTGEGKAAATFLNDLGLTGPDRVRHGSRRVYII